MARSPKAEFLGLLKPFLSTNQSTEGYNFKQNKIKNKILTRNTLDCDQSNYSSRIVFSHIPIEFGQKGISTIRSTDPKNPILEPNSKLVSAAEISPFAHHHLGFGETGNSAIRSADPEYPSVEPNMKWIGRPLAEI